MYDLIDECGEDLANYGYTVKKLDKFNGQLAYMRVDDGGTLDKGEYFIINAPTLLDEGIDACDYFYEITKNCLLRLLDDLSLERKSKFLIVGLGNPEILADCLGSKVVRAMGYANDNLLKICPNIEANTNINTADYVKYIKEGCKPDCIVLIDALASNSLSRLGGSIQLSSSGLTPGSGVGRGGIAINENEMGVPCISIGVPFMIFASALTDKADKGLLLAPKDIHDGLDAMVYIISKALDSVLMN